MTVTVLTCPVCKTRQIDDLGIEGELGRAIDLLGKHIWHCVNPLAADYAGPYTEESE